MWSSESAGATNQSGFSALPGGYSYLTLTYTPADQPFGGLGKSAYWWSSTATSTTTANCADVGLGNTLENSSIRKKTGISVRCVKD